MARTKATPKPIFSVKHDFADSLDAFCQAAVNFHSTVKAVLSAGRVPAAESKILENACATFRAALTSDD